MKKALKSLLVAFLCMLTISATMMSASAAAGPTMKVKSVATTSVTLYWTKNSSARSYELQRSTDKKSWSALATISRSSTEYTDSKSLTTGKTYYYRIRAKLLLGTTDWSATVSGKPLPAKVTGLKASSITSTSAKLSWSKVSGASGYIVQFYSSSAWKTYKTTTSNALSVTGLKIGKSYKFRVIAYKTVSSKKVQGPASSTLTVKPVLLAPAKLVLYYVSPTGLKVRWSEVKDAKGYEIYDYEKETWISTGTTRNYTARKRTAGTDYSFKVRAVAGSVKGNKTAKTTFRTTSAVPTNLIVKDATDNSVTLSWDPVSGATGYQVAYRVKGGSWKKLSLAAPTTATVTNLAGNTEYGFRVRSYVKNSNVSGISVNTTSSYTKELLTKTVLPAPTLSPVKVSAAATDKTKIKWTAVENAAGYSIEKYEAYYQTWLVYSFTTNTWLRPEDVTAEDNILTNNLVFVDAGAQTRSDVYRVRAIDTEGVKGTPSNIVTAFTSGLVMNNTASTFVYQQQITWPIAEDAVTYQVIKRSPLLGTEDIVTFQADAIENAETGKCKANIYLAPNSIHSIMILAKNSKGGTTLATNWSTFNVGDLVILASSHKYYNASVNSQLHYLAQAINNTKAYNDTITVKNNSKVAYSVDSLKIPILLVFKDTAEEVEEYFKKYDESGDLPTSASETFNSTVTFQNGVGQTEDGRTVRLKNFIEPSANSTSIAQLYNGQKYTAWKNGFSSVTAKKNSDGSVTMKLTFKQEETNTPYHNGYMSSFSSADFGADSGLEVKSLKVGKSTLTVTIDKDGILKSYVASSPYSALFAASFTVDESVNAETPAGSLVSMEMGISGNTDFNYTFIR